MTERPEIAPSRSAPAAGTWARHLEHLLGAPLSQGLRIEALQRLVDEAAAEGSQLDYKATRYQTGDVGKKELAKDVCAFANHQGGVIVLCIPEKRGGKGLPDRLEPLESVGDADSRHIRSVVTSWCAPRPEIDVVIVPSADKPEDGLIVIVAPPSPWAPHAVTPRGSDTFSWPVRRGTQTLWLTESELADAYRARASRIADEAGRLDSLITETVLKLEPGSPWLITAVVPANTRAAIPIDTQVVNTYGEWLQRTDRSIPIDYRGGSRPVGIAGPRRVVFSHLRRPGARHGDGYLELHTDGASIQVEQVYQSPNRQDHAFLDLPEGTQILSEEQLAATALAHLLLAVRHAADNGGAWGEATVTTVLTNAPDGFLEFPVALSKARAAFPAPELLGRELASGQPRSSITIDLSALASDGREAVVAAGMLGNGLANVFGLPELSQYTAEGAIRLNAIGPYNQDSLRTWAEANGVPTS